jgi:hypothetical protein
MASASIKGGTQFPEGTSVGAYLRSQWPVEGVKGAPSGSAVATATVTGGTATFTGLADGTRYVAYAQVGGVDKFERLQTDAATTYTAGSYQPPKGVVWDTIDPRSGSGNVADTVLTGVLRCYRASYPLKAGTVVTNLCAISGTAGATSPTHQWFCLVSVTTGKIVAVTADDLTTAWGVSTLKSLAVANGPYIPAADDVVAFGVMIAATTPNAIRGTVSHHNLLNKIGATDAVCWEHATTGLTSPLAVGTAITPAVPAAIAAFAYGFAT